ncbi:MULTISPECIES: hypothetical protein [Pseudomonas syringae group]|uniref:hypothetical protein n=2 Tax=Pseudomonas TaxID=286 RepID=UPI0006B910F2|nr:MULTISPECIES: hypothetical protein [Pseudomonas syringae group]
MTSNDHFFGQVEISSRTSEAILSLNTVVQLAQLVGRDHFTAQLRRLLSVHGHVALTNGTSAPDFATLLQHLLYEQIGYARLGLRQDISEGNNLVCTLIFVEGTLEIRAIWTGYKELRAYELIKTLLLPLRHSGLAERTFFLKDQGSLVRLPKDSENQLLAVLSYHGEPYSQAAHGDLQNLVDQLDGKSRF